MLQGEGESSLQRCGPVGIPAGCGSSDQAGLEGSAVTAPVTISMARIHMRDEILCTNVLPDVPDPCRTLGL